MKTFKKQTWNRKSAVAGILMLFMIGSGVISAKTEKPGAILIVQKKDGHTSKGELLTVKDGMLTLLIYKNASKVDVQLNELRSLRIEKKEAVAKGLWIGALAGAATGALVGFASGDDEKKGLFDLFTFTAGQKALGLGGILGVAGGVIGMITGGVSGIDKIIQLDGESPEKLTQVEAKLASLARYKTNPTSFWKFVFTGPSIETYIGTFSGAQGSGNFDFPGISGYAGTYSIDGNKINLKSTSHPSMQFSGQFTAKNIMTGTCMNNNETWNWTAARNATTAAVEQTPVMQSKLFSNLLAVSAAGTLAAPQPEPKPIPHQVSEYPDSASPFSASPERRKISRWHISLIPGIFHLQGADKFSAVIKENEFVSDARWSSTFLVDQAETTDYNRLLFLKDIRVEYSLTRRLAIGLVYAPLGMYRIWGSRIFEGNDSSHDQVCLGGRFRGNSYFLTAAFMPLPDTFLKNSMLKLGAGVGYGYIEGAFLTALGIPYSEEDEKTPYLKVNKRGFTRQVLALTAFTELDYFFGRHLSFGLNVDYKYAPFSTDACQLVTPYNNWSTHVTETFLVNVPKLRTNAGGFGAGISIGFHF